MLCLLLVFGWFCFVYRRCFGGHGLVFCVNGVLWAGKFGLFTLCFRLLLFVWVC